MMLPSTTDQITRVNSPAPEEFQTLASRNRPFIISGAMHRWKAQALWHLDYLRSIIGTATVSVSISSTNYFPWLHGKEKSNVRYQFDWIPFDEFAEAVSREQGEKKYY